MDSHEHTPARRASDGNLAPSEAAGLSQARLHRMRETALIPWRASTKLQRAYPNPDDFIEIRGLEMIAHYYELIGRAVRVTPRVVTLSDR